MSQNEPHQGRRHTTVLPSTLEDIELDLAELEPADQDAITARIRWHVSTR